MSDDTQTPEPNEQDPSIEKLDQAVLSEYVGDQQAYLVVDNQNSNPIYYLAVPGQEMVNLNIGAMDLIFDDGASRPYHSVNEQGEIIIVDPMTGNQTQLNQEDVDVFPISPDELDQLLDVDGVDLSTAAYELADVKLQGDLPTMDGAGNSIERQ